MEEIRLSAKDWRNPDSFWDDFLKALGAPEWHGRNLDALNDSISGGDVNAKNTPIRLILTDTKELPKSIVFLLHRLTQLCDELSERGRMVRIEFPDGSPPGWDYVGRPDTFGHMRVLDILREWDPIGVYGPNSDWPDDEYDGYAQGVMTLLSRGAAPDEIAQHLSAIVETQIGIGSNRDQNQGTASRLVNVWNGWKADNKKVLSTSSSPSE